MESCAPQSGSSQSNRDPFITGGGASVQAHAAPRASTNRRSPLLATALHVNFFRGTGCSSPCVWMGVAMAKPTATVERSPRRGNGEASSVEAGSMTAAEVARLLDVLRRVRSGDVSARLPWRTGVLGDIADAVNGTASQYDRFHRDLARLTKRLAEEGRTNERLVPRADSPLMKEAVQAINELVSALLLPGGEITRVISAVVAGDLTARLVTEGGPTYRGEFHRRAALADTMVAQLAQLAQELTRVTRQFGDQGRLGGQAQVPGAAGTWRDLTDSVNYMVANLTDQ